MKNLSVILMAFSVGVVPLHASPRTSANYTITTDILDSGGGRATSASYTGDASIGGITGISTVAGDTARAGFFGQINEPTGLTLTSPGTNVNESATIQIGASLALDDGTTVALPGPDVAWSVLSGPLTGISSGGLATAGAVYQDTGATARGIHAGFTATLGLTVVNSLPDNFGTYAADSIADDWQVQYFGLNNPDAGPLLDPDLDGFDNLFEYRARLVPTDALSFLSISIDDAPAGGHSITFFPRFEGCIYTLLGSNDLTLWAPVTGAITDTGTIRTIVDPAGVGPRRFYSLGVQRE